MQTKKVVFSVIAGSAFVVFLLYTFSSFIDSITTLCDYEALNGRTEESYYVWVGVFELMAALFGIAYMFIVAFIKKHRALATIITASVIACFMIVFVIVLKVIIPMYKGDYDIGEYGDYIYHYRYEKQEYAMFVAYLNIFVPYIASLLASTLFTALLCRKDKNNQSPMPETAAAPIATVESPEINASYVAPAEPAAQSAPAEPTEKSVFCTQCGSENGASSRFCTKCGNKL